MKIFKYFVCGGSWINSTRHVRAAPRHGVVQSVRRYYFGFRIFQRYL